MSVPSKITFTEIEEEILQYWKEQSVFQKSIDKNKGKNPYIFYDGPPFATGLPHYGHILTSYAKDTIPRYFTMKGYFVDRRWGWDCHGLPIEYEVEKMLGISGKNQILNFGIHNFNEKCRDIVLKYADEWEKIIERIGRWVDFDRQYRTMDLDFMESVIWVFSELFKKGLVYESPRVVAYCNRCMTPLSNFETGLDDSYRQRDDLSVTIKFQDVDNKKHSFLAWTTTPWTLPSNLALAVNEHIPYALIKIDDNDYVWIAQGSINNYEKFLPENYEIVRTEQGSELVDKKYVPVFPYFENHSKKAHTILAGDFIDTEVGTGIVHLAPAFGEDDHRTCTASGISLVDPVDSAGFFTDQVSDFKGLNVFDANKQIVRNLRERKLIFSQANYHHQYPHCWRCDNPLIYRAINSWYIKVADSRERLLANNEEINWVPSHIGSGRFKNWIADARDWSISRNRFWGTPIPVWRCDNCSSIEVLGSIKEIKEKTGIPEITELHKPECDQYEWGCSEDNCNGIMKRISEVFDCWFESGAMPYAQVHYPFENKQMFEENFPASFIVEYIAQTRGWFYTLLVEGTLLKDRTPFTNAICHGVILGEDGRKMSKRLKNFPDPMNVVNEYGSDALRIYLLSSPLLRGLDVSFSEKSIKDSVRRYLIPYWNVFHFYTSYVELMKDYNPALIQSSDFIEDKHILAELEQFKSDIENSIENYQIPSCYSRILEFIEILSGWYIRQNRSRFWVENIDNNSRQAFDTLYTILIESSQIIAPFIPFTMEYVYRHLTGKSVHLSDWPSSVPIRKDKGLINEIIIVRNIIESARSIREKNNLSLRQPLSSLHVSEVPSSIIKKYEEVIKDQTNVKKIIFHSSPKTFATEFIELDARELGPILKGEYGPINASVKSGDYKHLSDGGLSVKGKKIDKKHYKVKWMPASNQLLVTSENYIVVGLDGYITNELRIEGTARKLNRLIQNERKSMNLKYEQRITLCIQAEGMWLEAFEKYNNWLSEQCLITEYCDSITSPLYEDKGENGVLAFEIIPNDDN